MKLQQFREIFKSMPQLLEEKLVSRKQACLITASLFPPVIGKEILSDYNSTLPEYKNEHYESIAHMYCDGCTHYGLNQMVEFVQSQKDLKNECELNSLENQSVEC
jgi:hypothetical protein